MTREEFANKTLEEVIEWAYENLDYITDEEALKRFAIEKLEDDNFSLAMHIISAIYNNESDTEYYRYDYSMGTLETPKPITEKSDIEDLIW